MYHLDRVPTLVVVSDLDGTLLTGDMRISERTRRAIGLVRDQGGLFVAVTARPLRDSAWIARELRADLLLCAGGGVLYDPATERVLDVAAFPAERAVRLVATLRAAFPDIRLGVDYGDRCDLDPGFDMGNPGSSDREVEAPVEVAPRPVLKLIFQSDAFDTDLLADKVGALLAADTLTVPGAPTEKPPTPSVSCRAFAELLPAGVDKASRLDLLRTGPAAGVPTVAFGDMPNDLPMLRWADTAVAVANAHPAVLAACHRVTASNDDDGVAVFLERLLDLLRTG